MVLDEFFNNIFPVLDKKVEKHDYLCADECSVVDIVVYNELMTVLFLYEKDIQYNEYPNLHAWFHKIGSIPEVILTDEKFKDIVNKYQLI